jgi:hypothetical protein
MKQEKNMAMKKCKSCQQDVSQDAESCPKCGAVLKKKGNPVLKGCLIVVLLIFAGMGGCVLLMGKAASEVQSERKSEVARATTAPLSDVTWEEIDAIYNTKSKYTKLQKDEHWKNYKGKKVKWSGAVTSVGETFGTMYLQIKLNPDTFSSDVMVKLKPTERSKAINLSEDDIVRFVGILDDWGTLTPVTLDHGEIVVE